MTDHQRPRFDGTITAGNLLTLFGFLVAAFLAWSDLRSAQTGMQLALANEREHRVSLQRQLADLRGEQERRLNDGLNEVKLLLRGVSERLDRALIDRRSEFGPSFPAGPR